MGKWVHRLSSINVEARTAMCSHCGPAPIQQRGGGSWSCAIVKNTRRKGPGHEEYERPMLGTCPICRKFKLLVWDHDHKTKKKRGHICNSCNLMIGWSGDSPMILRMAATYLEASIPEQKTG